MFNILDVVRDRPVLNDDGVSVRDCKMIYAPKGKGAEIAPLVTNPYRGCGYRCAYCYVPEITKLPRAQFDTGASERPSYPRYLTEDAAKYEERGITEQVMLSTSSDPYHAGDTTLTRKALEVIQTHGMGICVLTKGGTRSLRDIDLFRPKRDAFACSLSSLDDAFARQWERLAARPCDRIKALKSFHERGVFTWVAIEPTLDLESSLHVIHETHEFVDLYKIGRADVYSLTRVPDWREYTLRLIEAFNKYGAKHYFRRDLQQYLPRGYFKPMRIAQYHGRQDVSQGN